MAQYGYFNAVQFGNTAILNLQFQSQNSLDTRNSLLLHRHDMLRVMYKLYVYADIQFAGAINFSFPHFARSLGRLTWVYYGWVRLYAQHSQLSIS